MGVTDKQGKRPQEIALITGEISSYGSRIQVLSAFVFCAVGVALRLKALSGKNV